jgi:hypothetical protein
MVIVMTRRCSHLAAAVVALLGVAALLPVGPAGRTGTGTAGASRAIAAGTVTARVALPSTRLTARSTVKGHLVLMNSGDQPVDLNHGCSPKWDVVLGRGPRPPGVMFTLDCGTDPFVVRPGTTRLPFELRVGRRAPGTYRAFLVANDPAFPSAPPVKVTVVSAN